MPTREHLHSVVAALQPVVEGVSDDNTEASTPCTDWDVRAVANHMLGTVEAMRRVGAGEPMDPEDPWGTGGDHMSEDWRSELKALLTSYADAWSGPEAWEGDAMDGAMPKRTIGDMGYVEVMLHGWDLAAASGQDVEFDQGAVSQALEVMDQIGEQGRSHGVFAAEVELPDDASDFAKVLAKAGRDSEWSRD